MPQVVIENPILNSAFEEPTRHFRFGEEGITNEVVENFCQIEAVETAIYITEVARKYGDAWIENDLRSANDTSTPALPRVALKMATGSGKTVVMAMLIAWQALNKLADRQDGHAV